ncbi:MAG: tyrosine-type recombinase/integrase [Pseudomonadota bacterium]|nr:tyrosine-type recombinase/integrase [Pseudomonadota bacterium]
MRARRAKLPDGVHEVRARLADGTLKTYHYAWRGGPRLVGEPGSIEFLESYVAAHRNRRTPDPSLFRSILSGFKASPEFEQLRTRTKSDYLKQLSKIELTFGDLPVDALEDVRVTRDFLEWRDAMASSPRQADYAWTVLMRVVNWARGRGLTSYRPPERVQRLYHADRSDRIWSEQDIAAFMAVAPATLVRALIAALETGQRQGDLLTLPWSSYDGTWIRLRQAKTGRRVNIPVTRCLRAILEQCPRTSPVILTNSKGLPWRPNAFRKAWGGASRKAGLRDLTFHDLRGTAVTRLSEAECTPQEIATITGHSLRDVGAILDRYSARTDKLAIAAIAKLERGKK